jgi:hypothetical protein
VRKKIMDNSTRISGFRRVGSNVNRSIKGSVSTAGNTFKSGFRGTITKVDPLASNINKGSVEDSGVESIRLARQTVSKTTSVINTTKRTIKTTKRNLKTAKTAAVNTSRFAVKTVHSTGKAVIGTVKVTGHIAVNVAAVAINPIAWLIAGILIIVYAILSGIIIVLMAFTGGGISSGTHHIAIDSDVVISCENCEDDVECDECLNEDETEDED